MVTTTQAQDLQRLLKAGVGFAGNVVEPADLPAIGLRDSARRPFQHQVIPAELRHRLGDVEEVERVGQIAAVKPNNRLDVPVKDRQPLTHIANCIGVGVVNLFVAERYAAIPASPRAAAYLTGSISKKS